MLLKSTNTGTMTDFDGNYTIQVPNWNATLVFSSIGFKTFEIVVDGQSQIDVMLEPQSEDLSEVVVVGYKSVLKREVDRSVTSIKTDDLQDIPSVSLLGKLAGKAPGVHAIIRTGLPGGAGGG